VAAPIPANHDKLDAALRLWRVVEDVGPNSVLRTERLLRGLKEILDGLAAVWVLAATNDCRTPIAAIYAGWDDARLQSLANTYLSQHVLEHPLIQRAIPSAGGANPASPHHLCRTAAIDDAAWFSSEFFTQIAEPLGIDDTIHSALMLCDSELVSILHVYRAADAPLQFGPEDCAAAALLHEHLLSRLRCDLPAAVDSPHLASMPHAAAAAQHLSPKQRVALRLLLSGDSEKQIAAKLRRSPHTVHMHVKAIYRTLGVTSRAELFSQFLQRPGGRQD
jgi:DNA-binding CsgD family transcriptional regulator